jgi:hypothetical protein
VVGVGISGNPDGKPAYNGRRYPVGPFAWHYSQRYRTAEAEYLRPDEYRMSDRNVLSECHVSGQKQAEYLERGIPEPVADRWAVKYLGLPAPFVWPEMIDDAIEDLANAPDIPDLSPKEMKKLRHKQNKQRRMAERAARGDEERVAS